MPPCRDSLAAECYIGETLGHALCEECSDPIVISINVHHELVLIVWQAQGGCCTEPIFLAREAFSVLLCPVLRASFAVRELIFREFCRRVYDFGIILDEASDESHRPQKCALLPDVEGRLMSVMA